MTLAIHPYAELFPLIEGQDLYDLAEDIRVNGLSEQIMLIEVGSGLQILDGRNRYRALTWLVSTGEVLGDAWGWDGPLSADDLLDHENSTFFKHFEAQYDGEPLAYVLSKNLRRRHLDESQRAMVAARLAKLGHGGDRSKAPIGALTDQAAAQALNVGERSVERAKAVQREASPEIVEAVDRGQIAVSTAAELAAQPAERQAEILARLPRDESGRLTDDVKKALAPIVKELRREKVEAKKERRADREAGLGRRIQALPEKRFGVAIEDFEWDHEAWSRETGLERHPSMHYETAADAHSPEEIVARCAERFACLADDCVLFKWVTVPHLAIGIRVLELQGFRYVTSLVWNKERPGAARGPGYWFTGEHEIVLVGVRGAVVPPAVAHFRSNFSAPVGGHSEKPDHLHMIIEHHWPNTPKVEFNARRRRPGWEAWGFDAPDVSPQGEIGNATGASACSSPAPAEPGEDRHAELADGLMSGEVDGAGYFVYGLSPSDTTRLCADFADRKSFLDEHVVAMTNPVIDGAMKSLGTCACGVKFKCAWGDYKRMDAMIELHWQLVEESLAPSATEPAAPPAPALAVDELDALKALSDFCHPRRAEICAAIAEDYAARGMAIRQGATDQWILRDAGKARLRELEDAARKDAPPAPAIERDPLDIPEFLRRNKDGQLRMALVVPAKPDLIDDHVQTRLPVNANELDEAGGLRAIAAGEHPGDVGRHLIGKEWARWTTSRGWELTAEGSAALASFVDVPAPAAVEARI